MKEPGFVELPFERRTYQLFDNWGHGVPKYMTHLVAPRHGTERAYVAYRCRCSACRTAATAARRRRRLAQRPTVA